MLYCKNFNDFKCLYIYIYIYIYNFVLLLFTKLFFSYFFLKKIEYKIRLI